MKTKSFLVLFTALSLGGTAFAQTVSSPSTNAVAGAFSLTQKLLEVSSTNYLVNLPIPDNNASGIASTKEFSTSIKRLGDVNVTLSVSGTYNGDLFGYLTHESGFSILLNRVGRTAVNSLGYGDGGLNLKFDDDAANGDIHTYRLKLGGDASAALSGALTGTWSPDGRLTDPGTVRDSDSRTAPLFSFFELDPNGKWTLFLADMAPGGTSTLTGWGLEVTAIPEPSNIAIFTIGGFLLLLSSRYRRKA